MFGLSYRAALVIVGGVMLAYVLFGGMIATTWVQIIKACLLLLGATLLAILVLAQFGMNPLALFGAAGDKYGHSVMAPGALVANPLEAISLGIALMFGTAGLPHILMRFYTVPDAQTARKSVAIATSLIGFFYLVTFILGFGASVLVGRDVIKTAAKGGNMAAPLLAEVLGGTGFLGFISAVAFATILAVVAGLTLSGAAALAHDLWGHVVRRGKIEEREQLKVARIATVCLAVLAILLGIVFEGQNVAFMVGLAFSIAASANFPALLLSMTWRRFTTRGAVASMVTGTVSTLTLILLSPTVWKDLLHNAEPILSLKNPGIITVPLSFVVGIVVSLTCREPDAEAGFEAAQHRMHFGPPTEK
jgi:cation/acetate symporter